MGKKNPEEEYPLLYVNKTSRKLWQVKRINPNEFRIKSGGPISRTYLQKCYDFYGVIDRFGVVIRYRKEGKFWKRDYAAAAYDPKIKKWKSVKESEDAIIQELNKMNRRNPELAFYDAHAPRMNAAQSARDALARARVEPSDDPNWREV